MDKKIGYVKYEGRVHPYVNQCQNGYEIVIGDERKWVGERNCEEVDFWEDEPKEPSYLTPINEFEKALINECTNLAQELIKKNRDYGDSFRLLYDEYGDQSTAWRLTDKLNRYKTLITQDNLVIDENKDDTLLDLAGYSILTLATKKLSRVGE